jgi:hypothetical protein
MSIIHVGHIKTSVLTRFGGLVDISDVSTAHEDQREVARLTRSLAAFVVAELGNIDDISAASAITDGTGDNGIDAVYYDAAEKNCFLVQSKWVSSGNGSVEVGDIHKFVQGVRDLLDADFGKFNSKMQTGTFECRGASVVNGAQTVGTIVDVAKVNGSSLQAARVLVRLVSLENCPEGFADELTRAANTQNRIEKRGPRGAVFVCF